MSCLLTFPSLPLALGHVVQLVQSTALFNTIEKIGIQWEEAEAEVEDVAGGLCLTLVLPYLRDVRLKAARNNTVDLEAFRIVGKEENDKGLATEDNSQYCAEFVIDGRNVNICNNDLSFEYSSESGLLHVYIESVHLDTPTDSASSAMIADFKTATGADAAARAGAGYVEHKAGSENTTTNTNTSGKSSSSSSRGGHRTRAGVVSKIALGVKNLFSFSRR